MANDILLITAASLTALAMIAVAALRGWQDWLQFKNRELEQRRPEVEGGATSGMTRIEMADLKERIRKLEAIAAGVDL